MRNKTTTFPPPLRAIIVLSITIVIVYALMQYRQVQPESLRGQEQTKTYQSNNMHFSIQISSNFQTKDTDSSVDLVSSDRQISIVRNGTNFSDLDSYISDFDSKRKLAISNSTKIVINGYEVLSRMVSFPEESIEQKSYYIYVNNYVYILSTSSEALFSDLDQIAQSFRYTP